MILALSYNQPKFCPSPTWNPDAMTFADESEIGRNFFSIFVDSQDTVYAANQDIAGFTVWLNNSTYQTGIIWQHGSGQLFEPFALFVTTNGDVYISNTHTYARVDKCSLNEKTVIPVMSVESSCTGLFVDINDTIYCSMSDHHKVVKKRLNDNSDTLQIAAGTGISGSNSTMLSQPIGIFVDINFDLYVADCVNNRIQLFQKGQLNATTVAGKNSSINPIKLSCPTSIVLDADKYLFITERFNNRIVRTGPDGFRCLVGCCCGSGSASNQLSNPRSLHFDSFGNMFVADQANHRIQKFLLSTNSCSKYACTFFYNTKESCRTS